MTRSAIPPVIPGSGCELFAQAAVLRVDRELGPAEDAALEAHLETCGACRARAHESEALSGLLRRWDAERAGRIEPPARLRMTIRSTVAEEGRWRRDEWRAVRFTKLATAAAVLLTLSAATALGLAVASARSPTLFAVAAPELPLVAVDTAESDSGSVPGAVPFVEVPGVEVPGVEVMVPEEAVAVSSAVTGSDARPRTWLDAEERERVIETLAFYEARRREREVFEQVLGEPAVWWTEPGSGAARLVTLTALDHLLSLGFGSVEEYRVDPTQDRTVPADGTRGAEEEPVVVDTGRRLADYLALPATPRGLEPLLRVPLVNLRDGIRVFAVPSLGAPRPGGALPAPLGLAEALAAGSLVLGEGKGDDLVAVVTGTTRPIFVPAGELVDGGRVHRLTTQAVWIPAAPGGAEARVEIPCLAAGTPRASGGGGPVPTGLLAPPTVRRLLAEGANPREVRTWLSEHLPYLGEGGRSGDFSLVASYPPQIEEGVQRVQDALLSLRARGVVVVDRHGGLLGLEITELPAPQAAALLTRLVLSYSAEDYMADFVRTVDPDAPRWRGEAPPAPLALTGLVGDVRTLVAIEKADAAASRPLRSLRTVESRTGTAVEVVERPADGAVILVSGLTR